MHPFVTQYVQTDLDWQAVSGSDALRTLSELHVRVSIHVVRIILLRDGKFSKYV